MLNARSRLQIGARLALLKIFQVRGTHPQVFIAIELKVTSVFFSVF